MAEHAPSVPDRVQEPPTPSLLRTLRSFRFAGEGLAYLARTQPNFRVHLVAMVAVIVLALGLGASTVEIGVLLLSIGLVLLGEAMNTAVEAVVDLSTAVVHPLAKIAKDVAAAGVLIAAAIAALTGLAVLGPRLLSLLAQLVAE
ncbi:MAG: diacylglycerol kinase family protein [Chloroflexota bacterium]